MWGPRSWKKPGSTKWFSNDYRARYYSPTFGRFISEDPLEFGGRDANLYAYVGNDPIDYTDPFGLRHLTDCEKRKLGPYIPKVDLDKADVHPGKVPWWFRFASEDFEGVTVGNDIYFRPDVYDPSTIAGLAKLGHELVHVGQYRNGMTRASYVWESLHHGYNDNKYEKPAYDKGDEIRNTMTKEKCGGCPSMSLPITLFLACLVALGCRDHQLERSFFDKPAGSRVERLRQYSLADQYKIFRYGNDFKEPPVMELADPIAERGAAAVPFLVDQLRASADDIAIRDILLIFETMEASRSYNVKADTSLMGVLASKVSGMKDKDWQAICLKKLQRIKDST
jgi:RHS repeat-associated protein